MSVELENRITAVLDALEDCIDEIKNKSDISEKTLKEYEKKVFITCEMAENALKYLPARASAEIKTAIQEDTKSSIKNITTATEDCVNKIANIQKSQTKFAVIFSSIFVCAVIIVGCCDYFYMAYRKDEKINLENNIEQLEKNIEQLEKNGGIVKLETCEGRLCIEVENDRVFTERGTNKKYMTIKRY